MSKNCLIFALVKLEDMDIKHTQRKETKYSNNEYDNMPSLDYSTATAVEINARNKNLIDMVVVNAVCEKYGFKHAFIVSTFGGDDAEFVLYLKTSINVDTYENYSKNFSNLSKEEYNRYWELKDSYNDTIKKLHDCIHELDEQTDLMFDCTWIGNSGIFGSHDTKRNSYCTGRYLTSWREITNRWSPLIHNTASKLSNGIYVMGYTRFLKPQPQKTPILADFEPIVLNEVRKLIGTKYTADFEEGKRQCDSTPFRALVVRYKSNKEYCGMIILNRDFIGRYHIKSTAPLCGEKSWTMDCESLTNELKSALCFI